MARGQARTDRSRPDGLQLGLEAAAVAVMILGLLLRRRAPFVVPAAMWLVSAVLSILDGRLIVGREALLNVEHAGRTALAEMRRLLDAMRSDGDRLELTPQPGLDTLPRLIEDVRAARGPTASDGLGHGLVGIGERVKIYGGEMTAGGGERGGFALCMRLPLDGR